MCGIIGIISITKDNIVNDLTESLYHLQHRGQDSYGFSLINNNKIIIHKDKGLIKSIVNLYSIG